MRRLFQANRNAEAGRSSLRVDDRPPAYASNVKTAPTHTLPGRDSVREPDESQSSIRLTLTDSLGLAETSEVATPSPNYIYYRIYAEDGAIPLKTSVDPSDPFLGRIKVRFVPPPRNAKVVKCSIAKAENMKDSTSTSLFLSPYSKSPMGDADKVIGLGSTPQEPLAIVAKMSDSERNALESDGRASTAKPDTTVTPLEIRYVYYLLYADNYPMPSKVAIDPEEPSLGRIRADSIAPPHNPTSIKRCISRVERNPALPHADLFADTSCDTPLDVGHISLLTDGPGLSPNEPMAVVQVKKKPDPLPVPVACASIPDGRYVIKNRKMDIYWFAGENPITTVYFHYPTTMGNALTSHNYQWDIKHDTNGNISMRSVYAPSSWAGADLIGSTVPVSWRLIQADNESYYLTTDMNRENLRVPEALVTRNIYTLIFQDAQSPSMDTLKEGDKRQMWEFISIY